MDVLIIGAGYAGLTLGALLARKGYQVLILEKRERIGGRAGGERDEQGFYWEYGQHSHRLAEEGPAYQVFQFLGEKIEFLAGEYPPMVYYQGGLYPRPGSILSIIQSKMFSGWEKFSVAKLMIGLIRANPNDWYGKSVWEFSQEKISSPERIKNFLDLLCFTIMVPKAEFCSAGELIDFMKKALRAKRKVGTPKGGSEQTLKKLEQIIKTNGEIHTNEEVKAISVKNGQVLGVETANNFYKSKAVVFTAPLDQLLSLLPLDLLPENLINYAKNLEHTASLMLYLISDEPIAKMGLIMGAGVPLWAHFPTVEDRSLAPKGKHFAVFCWMLERGKSQDSAHLQEAEKNLRSAIAQMFPGYQAKVLSEKKVFVPLQNGALLKPGQARPFRPSPEAVKIKGLFLAGDTTNGQGVSGDIAFSSALKAYQAVLSYLSD